MGCAQESHTNLQFKFPMQATSLVPDPVLASCLVHNTARVHSMKLPWEVYRPLKGMSLLFLFGTQRDYLIYLKVTLLMNYFPSKDLVRQRKFLSLEILSMPTSTSDSKIRLLADSHWSKTCFNKHFNATWTMSTNCHNQPEAKSRPVWKLVCQGF